MKFKLLLVDDEEDILEFLSYNLIKEGFEVQTAVNGKLALNCLNSYPADLIILDIMMPEMDGISCCEEIRKNSKFDNISILFLTAKGQDDTHIESLEKGGDDFVLKPINIKVLISRIKTLIRRKILPLEEKSEPEIITFDGLLINPLKMEVIFKSRYIVFAKKEFLLLYLLASYPGKVFTREEILNKIWGQEVIVGDRTIDVHIRKLREKLDDLFIKTIKGVGYKFVI